MIARALAIPLVLLALSPAAEAEELAGSDGPLIAVLLEEAPAEIAFECAAGGEILADWAEGRAWLASSARVKFAGGEARLGKHTIRAKRVRLWGPAGADGRQVLRVGGVDYEGLIELQPPARKTDGWRVVNRLPLERYLLGVVPAEMPASFPTDALYAQAVASRTYALYHLLAAGSEAPYHVHRDVDSQVYKGRMVEKRTLRAVESTRGQVLLSDGRLFESFFHSTCGGSTAAAVRVFGDPEVGALQPARCGYCADSKHYEWRAEVPEERLRAALAPIAREHWIPLGRIRAIRPLEAGPGGHASYLRIEHERGSFEVDATLFRLQAIAGGTGEIKSTSFVCEPAGARFVLTGHGWGHGVGLCQYGARGMAQAGITWRRILEHYYTGSVLEKKW